MAVSIPGSQRLRVVLVQPYLPEYRVPVYRKLAAEPDIDLTVVHASTPWIKNAAPDGFRAVYESMKIVHVKGHPVYWQPSFTQWADPRRCDAMILNWDVHYLHLVPAILKARRCGIGTALWGHGYSKNQGLLAWPRRRVARAADALVFYNEKGRSELAAFGVPLEQMFVAYNALDHAPIDAAIAQWSNRPAELRQFRADAGIAADEPVILFVARINPDRRLDLLLEAAKRLRDRAFKIVIVGGGATTDIDALRIRAAELNVADRLLLVGPCYEEQKLAPWFLNARLFCFPSYIGLSLMHAFAYRLPVLTGDRVSAHGPEIEALIPEVNGLLFRDGSVDDLTRQLARLLDEPALAARLGHAARQTIEDTYNIGRMVDGLANAARFARQQAQRRTQW